MTNWQENLKRILANHKMSKKGSHLQTEASDLTPHLQNSSAVLHLDDTALVKLMYCLSMTSSNACTCAEAFAMLHQYTELVASDEQAQQLMPLVKNHMDVCPDCREEFEILLRIVHTEPVDSPEN